MSNKVAVLFFSLYVCLIQPLHADGVRYISHYPQPLHPVVEIVLKLDETTKLLDTVRHGGLIQLELCTHAEAYWNGSRRVIGINPHYPLGTQVRNLLFELHNATTDQQFDYYDNLAIAGRINKETYVAAIERIEHANVLQVARLLSKGIKAGLFPTDAHWSVIPDFDDHYKMQQLSGHSQAIAQTFDTLRPSGQSNKPYRGTIPNLSSLTERDKMLLAQRLWHRANGA